MNGSAVLWIDPFSRYFEEDRLFAEHQGAPHADDYQAVWRHVRAELATRGVEVHTADLIHEMRAPNGSLNLYISLGIRARYRRLVAAGEVVPVAFFAFECPVVEPRLYRELTDVARVFPRVFSYSTAEALRPFLTAPLDLSEFRLPQPHDRVHEALWRGGRRRFLVMINSNKVPRASYGELYTERLRAVAFFERHDEIDLYGVGWSGPPFRLGDTWVPGLGRRVAHRARAASDRLFGPRDALLAAARSAYRGAAAVKAETLGAYTFALCFENMILEGWITEKLFDCLLTGTIPVYWGAPDIDRWVPPECYIDMRSFAGYDELRAFLRDLSPKELDSYREAGRAYIESDLFRPFSKAALADLFVTLVEGAAVHA